MTIIRQQPEYFLDLLESIHSKKYTYIREEFLPEYSDVKVSDRKITRVCKHSSVTISYKTHRKGKATCSLCNKPERVSRRDKFINKVKLSHPHLDLSNVEYSTQYEIKNIRCSIHSLHYNLSRSNLLFKCKYGSCPSCILNKKDRFNKVTNKTNKINNKKKTLEQIINEANIVHDHRYDYSKFNYINVKTKGKIICITHGEFYQTMDSHINKKANCPECVKENNFITFTGRYNHEFFKKEDAKNSIGYIYLIKLYSDDEEFVKIGITSKEVEDRFKYLYLDCSYNVDYLLIKKMNIYNAFLTEQYLLNTYKDNKYKPISKFKGYTECFNISLLNTLLQEIDSRN